MNSKSTHKMSADIVALQEELSNLRNMEQAYRETEAALARSRETLERAQAIAHVGSWDWDIVGGGLEWTDEIYRIFGLSPQEFGATYDAFLSYIHPDDRQQVIDAVGAAVADAAVSYEVEHRVVRPDGSERNVTERGKVYRDESGKPIRMIGTVQDITEKKKAEAFKSLLFESSPIGLALCDMQGKIIDINPAFANIIGREIEESKQITYWQITPEDYADEEAKQIELLNKTGRYGPYEKEYIHKDGHRVPVRLSGQIVVFEGEPFIWSSVEDITETKQARDALQRLNVELEDRVDQRTAELRAVNESLRISVEQLKQTQAQLVQSEKMASLGAMVAGVAHEINTPVGVGVTAVSHLQMKLEEHAGRYRAGELTRDDFESLLATTTESSRIIQKNLERAANLIRSFKQVAVDQTSNEERQFNLKDYLNEVMQSLQPHLKSGDHEVELSCSDDIALFTTPGALWQVITNLVVNSVTHGFSERQHGKIRVVVNKLGNDRIRLDYSDNGKGMSAETVRKVFEPFFTTQRGKGGTGLGMHIAYNLVTQTLAGRIECSSIKGEGALFRIELPTTRKELVQKAG